MTPDKEIDRVLALTDKELGTELLAEAMTLHSMLRGAGWDGESNIIPLALAAVARLMIFGRDA